MKVFFLQPLGHGSVCRAAQIEVKTSILTLEDAYVTQNYEDLYLLFFYMLFLHYFSIC